MTILPRGTGLGQTGAEILFPFLDPLPIRAPGGPDPFAGAGWTGIPPVAGWTLASQLGAGAGISAMAPGLAAWPQAGAGDRGDGPAAGPGEASVRPLPGAEAPGAWRLKQGFPADPLHGLPAHDLPHAPARQALLEAGARNWLDEAAQADGFVFLPADPGAPGLVPGAEHPDLRPGDWLGLLVPAPEADPVADLVPDALVLAGHGSLLADHVFF